MSGTVLDYMKSARIGEATEIAVMAPIRPGRVPGERRTFEERLRFAMGSVQERTAKGIPTELTRISTIHFGRMMIIRPEMYLTKSGVDFTDPTFMPLPLDEAEAEAMQKTFAAQPQFRSWLLTLVVFDGDLKVYFRDIAEFLGDYFNRIFENTEDFPGVQEFEDFWSWIRRYQISADLFHSAYPDLTAPHIKYLQDFKRQFDLFVETVRSPTGRKVEDMNDLFDQFLQDNHHRSANFPAPGGVYLPLRKKGE
ncbi:hypothetical protein ACFQ14_06670 [Pseudahrensia aquimaris]|uniref:Uncharacterized protein n=1 Tax=Pseudahrensia aquimaris TaxID=744461 RepID=A0ABW3FES9_9HYPH